MFLSGYIKDSLGIGAPFAFGIGGAILCVLYTYFFIEDSRKMRPIEVQNGLDKQNVNKYILSAYLYLLYKQLGITG